MCLKPAEVQRALANKANIIRWIEQSNVLIDFYERRAGGYFTNTLTTPPQS